MKIIILGLLLLLNNCVQKYEDFYFKKTFVQRGIRELEPSDKDARIIVSKDYNELRDFAEKLTQLANQNYSVLGETEAEIGEDALKPLNEKYLLRMGREVGADIIFVVKTRDSCLIEAKQEHVTACEQWIENRGLRMVFYLKKPNDKKS